MCNIFGLNLATVTLLIHPFIVGYVPLHLFIALVTFIDGIAILILVVDKILALLPYQLHWIATILI